MATLEELRIKAAALKAEYDVTQQECTFALMAKQEATVRMAKARKEDTRAYMKYQRIMGAIAIAEDNEP